MGLSIFSRFCGIWRCSKRLMVVSIISTARVVTFERLWNRAILCLRSLLVDSIGKVKSLPTKCLLAGKTLENPGQSSVTKQQDPLSIFLMNFVRVASERLPNWYPRDWRDTPSIVLHIQILFFFHWRNAKIHRPSRPPLSEEQVFQYLMQRALSILKQRLYLHWIYGRCFPWKPHNKHKEQQQKISVRDQHHGGLML